MKNRSWQNELGKLGGVAARSVRRAAVLVAGVVVLTIGVAGIVLPFVPAVIIIPAGLALLATEFVWARWLLQHVQQRTRQAAERVGIRRPRPRDRRGSERAAVPDSDSPDPSRSV